MAGIMLWLTISGIVEPIIFSNRIWEPARCTFAGEMTFERVHRRKGPDGYRVIAPVTVSYAGNSWDLIGHRYPHRSMTDSVQAELAGRLRVHHANRPARSVLGPPLRRSARLCAHLRQAE
jgi:hypothetical protein